MFPLFETVRIVNGVPMHPDWHRLRMHRAVRECWGTEEYPWPELVVPAAFSQGVVRCNILYGAERCETRFEHYEKREIRTLKKVACGEMDYHLKFCDRSKLDALFALRGEADEVIIIRDGLVTDTSISNLVFFDGSSWYTPSSPLLRGTCRERLLAEGKISEREIREENISDYAGCKLINAMRDPDDELMIAVSAIF